ncbi:copper homeostasis membrane protein CopD [Erwinia persicina]|uniref:copper homeostasis membrane protein CopD n=1 Tax=Erwinia persicina TaxID=55211 RepID=UPI0021088ECD|nr:copper homeostasis membrane protein CopD [Erwinia persicina]MCQ4095623.1 copper homeostasis membrane protein CopD [Erwinia persicina]MCQ4102018.1 copper homeostasis membrane protein CopD [Erwinia persicina]
MALTSFYILCRWLHFAALISLAGAAIYIAWLAPERYRTHLAQRLMPSAIVACWLALLSAVLLLAAQTGQMGDGWQDTLDPDVWLDVLQTQFGRVWQGQLALAILGCLSLTLQGEPRQRTLLICALFQLAGLAFTGHAAMLDGWGGLFQRVNQMVHLLSAAFWAGGLLPLIILMRDARSPGLRHDAVVTMMRFSRYGHLAVTLVVVSGAINALLLLGWPPASFRLYSQLLVVKTLLVGAMVAIALYNRYCLVPRFQRSAGGAEQRFITSTLVEVGLAAAVLLVVGVFATLEPA